MASHRFFLLGLAGVLAFSSAAHAISVGPTLGVFFPNNRQDKDFGLNHVQGFSPDVAYGIQGRFEVMKYLDMIGAIDHYQTRYQVSITVPFPFAPSNFKATGSMEGVAGTLGLLGTYTIFTVEVFAGLGGLYNWVKFKETWPVSWEETGFGYQVLLGAGRKLGIGKIMLDARWSSIGAEYEDWKDLLAILTNRRTGQSIDVGGVTLYLGYLFIF